MFRILAKLAYWTSVTTLVCCIVILAISIRVYRAYDVSNKDAIMNKGDTGLMLHDRTGELFFAFNRARPRIFIPLTQVPILTQQAIIAAEDQGFYSHFGFSPRGILRSLYLDLKHQDILYGGSTITQQLVKNSLLTTKKSITRKFQEIIIAIKLERHFSKDEILEMYMNSAYFGEGVFGIEAAAQTYFNKGANELSLSESSVLAGLLPAPAAFSPFSSNEKIVKERQLVVLNQMEKQQFITAIQKKSAVQAPIVLNKQSDNLNKSAPHFALMVKQELDRIYGEEAVIRAGMKVTTSIDLAWQKYAEEAVASHVASERASGVGNGATVVIDPKSGEVRALVGSVGWFQEGYGKANMAISPRQTGSAFKPIVYAAGIEEKVITAATILHDIPTTFAGDYKPKNYDNRWRGPVLVRRALANSLNIPAVETIMKTGIPKVVALAKDLGISTMRENAQFNPSTALGAENITLLDLTGAYGALANNGTLNPKVSVLRIRDKYDREVAFLKDDATQALDPKVAFIISSMLSDNSARAEIFGNSLTTSRPAAVKTGTSQQYRDGWTVGYTPNLAVGVWIGNNDNTPMQRIPASIGAAPLWQKLMEHYMQELPNEEFTPPVGLIARPVCNSPSVEYFLPGTEPNRLCLPPIIRLSASPLPTLQDTTLPSEVLGVNGASPVLNVQPNRRIPSSNESLLPDPV